MQTVSAELGSTPDACALLTLCPEYPWGSWRSAGSRRSQHIKKHERTNNNHRIGFRTQKQ